MATSERIDRPLDGGQPEVFYLNLAPRRHTGEFVALLITLALLFVSLVLLVGHPRPPTPVENPAPVHTSAPQSPR